jgi:type II secretory pathway pseudopilin PulG
LKRHHAGRHVAPRFSRPSRAAGFTLLEALIVVAVGVVLTALAIPVISNTLVNMRMNSSVSQFTAALSSSRFQAIKASQPYTLVITAPANTYVLTNTVTGYAAPAVPFPSYIDINGGGGTFTYTLCPNGTVYGAGGACPGTNQPPSLSFQYQNRQIDIAVSEVGNVSTTTIQ